MSTALRIGPLCLLVFFFGYVSCQKHNPDGEPPSLTIYCAVGLRKPLENVAAAYTRECGTSVVFQFGGSGALLSQIRVAKQGDLYIAADDASIANARTNQIIQESLAFASLTPVIAVKHGNPKAVKSFADLSRSDLKVAIANPETASIGKTTRVAAGQHWNDLAHNVKMMKPTVTEIAADLALGAVDAAVIWAPLTAQFSGLEAIHVPELDSHKECASAAVLTVSKQPREALKFARFLAAPEHGGALLTAVGFDPIPGDPWSQTPTLMRHHAGIKGN